MLYDLIIIGGGPAGAAAAIYATRKKIKTILLTEIFGGQSSISDSIENWIGSKKLTGFEFSQMLEEHVRAQEGIEIETEKALSVKEIPDGLEVATNKGTYQSRALVVASGGRRRHLNIAGEDKFEGKGVSYCSTCDAPLFKNKITAVIGGGNAGAEAVIDLLPYVSKVYLINRGPKLTADPSTIGEIEKSSKVEIINNVESKEILGGKFVSGLRYLDKTDNQTKEIKLEGIFVEIGSMPNSEIVKGLVNISNAGEVIVDHKTGATSNPKIFAAGDVTDEIYKQNNISAGDGVIAALSAYNYLLNIKKRSPAEEK